MEHQLAKKSTQKEQSKKPASSSPLQSNSAGRITTHPVLRLQRAVGNQAVQRLLNSENVQTKLAVGQPGDVYEQEADQMARQVVTSPPPHTLQRRAANNANSTESSTAAPIVNEVLNSRGHPLDDSVRLPMETHFGSDFSQVRVHTGATAAESAQAQNAQAYTVGSDIVFGTGKYAPETSEGKRLMAHELTHVVQQGAAYKNGDGKSVASAPRGMVQRQFITPLGQGGGFHGLTERDRQAATSSPVPRNVISIPEAIQGGWLKIRDLDEADLRTANVAQRLAMLAELIQAYWTGGPEEEAIIRILSTTPEVQAEELVKQLSEQTINDKSYLRELDRVVDLGNNLELHAELSKLRAKAMGPEKTVKALLETAPTLPWHDVMGFFEDIAVFFVSSTPDGKVRIKYPARLIGSRDFADELEKLPIDIFTSGHEYEPDQVLKIHDYDEGGRIVPVVAQELIGYRHAGVRGFLKHVATVASLALPIGTAETVGGKIAIFVLDRLLPITFTIIDENRLNIVKWFPKWGPQMLYYADLVQFGVGAFGISRFAIAGWKIFQSWRDISKMRAALEGTTSVDVDAERFAVALEKRVGDIADKADEIRNSTPQAPGQTGAGVETVTHLPMAARAETKTAQAGRALFGKKAPPPSGEVSPELRKLALQQFESKWFRFKMQLYANLTDKGVVDWDELIEVVQSAEFREYATAWEAIKSGGYAGLSEGKLIIGAAKPIRVIPAIGKGAIQHELVHVYQELTLSALTREAGGVSYGQIIKWEVAANVFGSPGLILTYTSFIIAIVGGFVYVFTR